MSIQASAAGSNEPRRDKAAERTKLFSIYKSGQGYATRLGSALGAGAVVLFVCWFAFRELAVLPAFESSGRRFAAAVALAAVLAFVAQWVMNGPKRAQFLIDTDSEMKKVNWASWPELIGSTRVVIFFMLLTALFLFVFDTQYHALFYGVTVWHIPFEKVAGVVTGLLLSGTLLAIGVGLLRQRGEGAAKTSGVVVASIGAVVLVAWIAFAFLGKLPS